MTDMQVKCFLVLAENLSFTKSAELLNISQPTLSKQIKALEKNLCFPLFERAKNIILTPAGRIMHEVLASVDLQLTQGIENARNVFLGQKGLLRIGVMHGWNVDAFLQKVFLEFKRQYPEIALQVYRWGVSELLTGLERGDIDVALLQTNLLRESPSLKCKDLRTMGVVIVCASNYNNLESFMQGDYSQDRFITLSHKCDPTAKAFFEQICGVIGVKPKHILEVDSVEAQIHAVEYGFGLCIMSSVTRVYDKPGFVFREIPGYNYHIGVVAKKRSSAIASLFFNSISLDA